jgi:hypothetical protein
MPQQEKELMSRFRVEDVGEEVERWLGKQTQAHGARAIIVLDTEGNVTIFKTRETRVQTFEETGMSARSGETSFASASTSQCVTINGDRICFS